MKLNSSQFGLTKNIINTTLEKEDCRISFTISRLFCKGKKADLNGYNYRLTNKVADLEGSLLQNVPAEELKGIEQNFHGAEYRYLVVKKEDKPILMAYFQIFTLTYKNFNNLKTNNFLKQIIRYFLQFKKVKVLFLGNVLRTNQKGYFYDEHELTESEAISLVKETVEKIAHDENLSASILKEITGNESKQLINAGYSDPFKDLVMEMSIDPQWKKFDDYQSALSRKYAARAKKIRKSAEVLQKKQLTDVEIKMNEESILQLFNQVLANQTFVLGILKSDYFHTLKTIYKDQFEFYTYSVDGEPVAFYSAFVTEDSYDVYYVGFDYRLNIEYSLYFNILFSALERAIQLQKKTLKLGRTSLDAKANMGATAVELPSYIKLYNAPQWLLDKFVCYFSTLEDDKWKDRNPLKQKTETALELEAFA